MKLSLLILKVLGVNAKKNMFDDFLELAKKSGLSEDPQMREICFTWFALGHINSADKSSNFITKQFGPEDKTKVH